MTGDFKGRGNWYIPNCSSFCPVNCRATVSNYQLSHIGSDNPIHPLAGDVYFSGKHP